MRNIIFIGILLISSLGYAEDKESSSSFPQKIKSFFSCQLTCSPSLIERLLKKIPKNGTPIDKKLLEPELSHFIDCWTTCDAHSETVRLFRCSTFKVKEARLQQLYKLLATVPLPHNFLEALLNFESVYPECNATHVPPDIVAFRDRGFKKIIGLAKEKIKRTEQSAKVSPPSPKKGI